MLIDRLSEAPVEYELTLCRPDEQEICVLHDIKNFVYIGQFPTTDEIEFNIPYNVQHNGKIIKNPIYDLVKGDYLIHVKRRQADIALDEKYFIIDTPRESSLESDMKEVHAYSREYELNKKIVRGYNYTSRSLYNVLNESDSEGIPRGVMNYITQLTSWSLDVNSFTHVDFIDKFRRFDVSEKTVLDFLVNDVQEAFGVVFLFDTINKVISVRSVDKLSNKRGLYIDDQNYLRTIIKEVKHDEVVTRLYPFGANDISIISKNPTGSTFIEDFSFYKTLEYMEQDLIDALNQYDIKLKNHEGLIESISSDINILVANQLVKRTELRQLLDGYYVDGSLVKGLTQLQDDLDDAILRRVDLADVNRDLKNKELEVLQKQAEIDWAIIDREMLAKHPSFNYQSITSIESQIDSKLNEITQLNDELKKENNFTVDQIKLLDTFIKEKVWIDNSYETPDDLYEEAVKHLQNLSQPPVQFEIEVIDFLSVIEGKIDRRKLVLGDLVDIQYEKFATDITVRLVGFTHSPETNELMLMFSNKDSLDNPYIHLAELQKNAITTSTTIDMSKLKWDQSEDNASQIREIIEGNLDAAKNKVLAGKNQSIIVDERGIWLREKNEDESISPEQIRMINNVIAITDDGWETARTAITPEGVVAETVMGTLLAGQNLIIDASNKDGKKTFTVNSEGVTLDGASLTIKGGLSPNELDPTFKDSLVELNKDYTNGIRMDTEDGLIVTRSDDMVRSIFNATDGIKIEIKEGNSWVDGFYYDVDKSKLIVNGEINALGLKINGEDVLTGEQDGIKGQYIKIENKSLPEELNQIHQEFTVMNGQLTSIITETIPNLEEDYQSAITQSAQEIRTEVSLSLGGVVEDYTSLITQTADNIRLKVSTEVERLDGEIESSNSAINLLSNEISSIVSFTDVTGNQIASRINQTATNITIDASKIDLRGAVTFSDFSSSLQSTINNKTDYSDVTTIVGDYIRTGTIDLSNQVRLTGSGERGIQFHTGAYIGTASSAGIRVDAADIYLEGRVWIDGGSTRLDGTARFG